MVQMQTILTVADNSGAKKAQCIKVLGGSHRMTARIGDLIIVAIKVSLPHMSVKKGDVRRAVIVRASKEQKRPDGTHIRFDDNACVIVDDYGNPIGKRVFGPVSRELRDQGYLKIVSLASEVL